MKAKLVLLAFLFSVSSQAATRLSFLGAASWGSGSGNNFESPSLLLGTDLTFGLGDIFQIGPFFDYNNLTVNGGGPSGPLFFYGGVVRIGFGELTHIFLDGQIGFTSESAGPASDTTVGFGFGIGYSINLGPISFRPRLGYRDVPTKFGANTAYHGMTDLGLMITLGL